MATRQYIGARYVPTFANPIEWDNIRQYEALTIVTHNRNSYTSKKPVPPGIDISNTEYWVNTGNYNAQINQISAIAGNAINKANALQGKVDGIETEVDALSKRPNTLVHAFASGGEIRLYVDGVNGNDNNDGTAASPFKTLTHVINKANNLGGRVDVRCYIVSPGVYEFPYLSMTGMAIHITGNVDGVIIHHTGRDFSIYETHVNLNNVTIQSEKDIKFESCCVVALNCRFGSRVAVYSGKVDFNGCTFDKGIGNAGGKVIVRGTSTFNTHGNNNIYCNCGELFMYGTFSFVGTAENTVPLMDCYRSEVNIVGKIVSNTQWPSIDFQWCKIYTNRAGMNVIKGIVNQIKYASNNWVFTEAGVAVNPV